MPSHVEKQATIRCAHRPSEKRAAFTHSTEVSTWSRSVKGTLERL